MITYKDIKKAVNGLLKNKFNIEINSNDVKEGFNRPSFFVAFDDANRSSTPEQVEKSLTIRIHYFPTDRYNYSIEVLDIQEQLENLFDLKLGVLDRKFNIHEASTLVTDGVLEFSFDIYFFDVKDIPTDVIVDEIGKPIPDSSGNPIPVELMQTLDIKKG